MKRSNVALLSAEFISVGLATPVYAGNTYPPAQLGSTVNAGRVPKQGLPSSQNERVDYSTCITIGAAFIRSVRSEYTTSTVLCTNIARIEKVWTNDSLACSAPDGNLVTTTAPYL